MKQAENEDLARIISRYFAGIAGEEEKTDLEKWVDESDENNKSFRQIAGIWNISDTEIIMKGIDQDEALEKVLSRVPENGKFRKIWTYWAKVAAILIIPLIAANILWFTLKTHSASTKSSPVYSEVYATFGTRTALKLIDGTLVWLNSGSSLRYPDRFINGKREVYLDGEAYFEVSSDIKKPFIVRTSDLTVKATGTKFDVLGYKSQLKSEITLIDGKVSVCKVNQDGQNTLLSELSPDQHLTYDRNTSEVSVQNEDPYKFYSWKDGRLIFRNEPLADVVSKLSQVFNVDIELQGNPLQDYRYRATFEDESLSEILKLLEISSPIKYREIKRLPLPDGSFPKKKVIIYPVK